MLLGGIVDPRFPLLQLRIAEKPRIWSPSLRLDVSEWLLSSGHAAQVKAQRRPHPAGGVEETLGNCGVELPRGEGLVVEYLGVFEPKRTFFFLEDLCIASSIHRRNENTT